MSIQLAILPYNKSIEKIFNKQVKSKKKYIFKKKYAKETFNEFSARLFGPTLMV
jgi:hypothetical protein